MHTNFSTSLGRGPGPLPIPITPNTLLTTGLKTINESLRVWGYCDNPQEEFIPVLLKQMGRAYHGKGTEKSLKEWAQKREPWIADGDRILDALQLVLSTRILDDMNLCSPAMRNLWNLISDTIFSLTYMLSAVEARVDMILYQAQWLHLEGPDDSSNEVGASEERAGTQVATEMGSDDGMGTSGMGTDGSESEMDGSETETETETVDESEGDEDWI